MTLVDSNVLIDLLGNDRNWLDWSTEAMDRSAAQGPLLINELVFAELAVRSTSEEALMRDLANLAVSIERIPVSALYLAGKVFARYRATGGTRASLLPDFFVGAHAQIARMTILTRDARRYRTHFPAVPLITP
ncbi:MAG TPA: type II toxin-antitoxin system VapC family toxin [Rhizomicrobium sp.]|nr:type II toxin-antitoxin system VapC family toxin [Rhizomicrobium sp.]